MSDPDSFDPPYQSPHLHGKRPIYDLRSCVEAEDDVALIIFREVYCSERDPRLTSAEVGYETICVKSPALRTALSAVAGCYFNNIIDDDSEYKYILPTRETEQNTSAIAEKVLYAPHLFLYHHRSHLKRYAAEHASAVSHVNALLGYANHTYGYDYEEAENLFSRGLVTRRHLAKLFMPNDLVLSCVYGQPTIQAILQWAKLTSNGSFDIKCWSWQADGGGFARKSLSLELSPGTNEEEVEIKALPVVPLAYVSPELRVRLELRGRKHWSLRSQSYVSYKGWNVSSDQFYASQSRYSSAVHVVLHS